MPITKETISVPAYIKLQFISDHLLDETSKNVPDLLPDALKWRKLTYLSNMGYLGRYPGYFLNSNGNIEVDEYINHLLKLKVLEKEEEFNDSHQLRICSGLIPKDFNNSGGSYYIDGHMNWSSADYNIHRGLTDLDLSLPYKFDIPTKSDVKFTIPNYDELYISTQLLENSMFNLYPRGMNRGNAITIQLDSHVTPLLGIYYYEIDIINGLERASEIAIGFIKDDIHGNNSHNSFIDMRGADDRCIGWYGKNGILTIWNDKRIEKSNCTFGINDTVGIGYNLFKDTFFITKNGLMVCEIGSVNKFFDKFYDIGKNVKALVPSMSLGSWCSINVNIGTERKFKFDIENYVNMNKAEYMNVIANKQISNFKVQDLVIDNKSNLTNYVDNLVLSYLKYRGYYETFLAMESDMRDLIRPIIKPDSEIDNLHEVVKLKNIVKQLINDNEFLEIRKLLDSEIPGFFTTYRKINFKLKIVHLIHMLVFDKVDILEVLKLTSQLKKLFKEDDCQYYIDRFSILFSYDCPQNCKLFKEFYYDNKVKLIHGIIMAINEQNNLSFMSSLDLIILRTDQNLEGGIHTGDRGKLLINLLEDYIKY